MRSFKIVFLVLLLQVLNTFTLQSAQTQEEWEEIPLPADNLEIKTIAVDPTDPRTIYVGSAKNILKTRDFGKSWKNILTVKGNFRYVNSIIIDKAAPQVIYAATQNGLFRSKNYGKNWHKIFKGIGNSQKNVRCIFLSAENKNIIYVGTKDGLFISEDAGKSWLKPSGEISNIQINHIVSYTNSIFAATNQGVFELQDGTKSWEKIFTASDTVNEENTYETFGDTADNEIAIYSKKTPNYLAVNSKGLYVGTNSGVFLRRHKEQSWNKITTAGLTSDKISSLLILEDQIIYAATTGGIFKISEFDKRWTECYKGLLSTKVNFLTAIPKDKVILAATKKGIYKTYIGRHNLFQDLRGDPQLNKILSRFNHEPGINEVLRIASKYAELNAEKIQEWRRAAKRKALLPTLSVGIDHDIKGTYEIYTSSTKSYWTTGPESQSTGWDVSLSWDLGELIWNDDQTSIDVRSRLMVQLRDDILDETRRLYFERRRLQISLLRNSPKNIDDKLEKQLRLQELTAGIDALTGGWFSKRIQKQFSS